MRLPEAWADRFEAVRCPAGTLIFRHERREALLSAGLDRPEVWRLPTVDEISGSGRGPSRRVALPQGPPLLLKQLRRGGRLAPLWRERFPGTRRLLDNLWIPLEAARRGVPTPPPMALRLVAGPRFLHRAWLAVEVVVGGVDLAADLAASPRVDPSRIALVARTIRRMHDVGVDHTDLNLGNLLLREGERGTECFVIDLDRARLQDGGLSVARRERALRRLERSTFKLFGDTPVGSEIGRMWYEGYAAGDPGLSRRLALVRRRNRWQLRLHRLGWRR